MVRKGGGYNYLLGLSHKLVTQGFNTIIEKKKKTCSEFNASSYSKKEKMQLLENVSPNYIIKLRRVFKYLNIFNIEKCLLTFFCH